MKEFLNHERGKIIELVLTRKYRWRDVIKETFHLFPF